MGLLNYQLFYLIKIIYKPFLFWMTFIIIMVLLTKFSFPPTQGKFLILSFFDGVSLQNIPAREIQLPILWLIMLLIPTLILFDGLSELNHNRWIQLKGLQITISQLIKINLLLAFLLNVIYGSFIFGLLIICSGIQNIQIIILYLGFLTSLMLLTILQLNIGIMNFPLSVIVNIIVIIGTVYTEISTNPLNLTMISRMGNINVITNELLGIIMITIGTMTYYYTSKKINF